MRKMLIIHPHWPPSNTVGVHRVRLIANELHANGWHATVLTVDERDIEDDLAPGTQELVAPDVEVIKVRARPVRTFMGKRLIGDIGLRAWHALKAEAENQLKNNPFDFIWFSVPSWYTPLMGPSLHKRYKVAYGVDYRDPWVYELAQQEKGFNRATATVTAAKILEPLALQRCALVSGVSEGYLSGIDRRYPNLRSVSTTTFQMGFSKWDHSIILSNFEVPFTEGKRTFVYAGAYSPNWEPLFHLWLRGLRKANQSGIIPPDVEFLFIGTGNPSLPSIANRAQQLGLDCLVREIPNRIPFLQVQQILRESSGAIVIGSVEPHYSASKIFQCLITAPRVMGFFHEASEGASILAECHADTFFVPYNPNIQEEELIDHIASAISKFTNPNQSWDPDLSPLEAHTSARNAQKFLAAVEQIIR